MFKIVINSSADLPRSFIEEHNLCCINLSYILDGKTYGQGEELDIKTFFKMMREGAKPTTSQINPDEAKKVFEELIADNKEILVLGFSSGLSGTAGSLKIAAEEVMEEHADVKIIVIDTLCASNGEGLIDYYAVKMAENGASIDEVAKWVEDNKLNIAHIVTVDDLFDLWRGGRVSKTSAFLGTLASIKPLIHVNNEGKLIVIDKIRGRKKSLLTLVDYMEKKMGSRKDFNKDMVMISHGDVLEDAEFVANTIRERFGFENIMINNLGPVIGSHTGPSLVALFFMADER